MLNEDFTDAQWTAEDITEARRFVLADFQKGDFKKTKSKKHTVFEPKTGVYK